MQFFYKLFLAKQPLRMVSRQKIKKLVKGLLRKKWLWTGGVLS